jgi:hypothetical protein
MLLSNCTTLTLSPRAESLHCLARSLHTKIKGTKNHHCYVTVKSHDLYPFTPNERNPAPPFQNLMPTGDIGYAKLLLAHSITLAIAHSIFIEFNENLRRASTDFSNALVEILRSHLTIHGFQL